MTAPGWYPDPSGQGQRYFDGTNWTDQRAPAGLQAAPQPPKPPGSTNKVFWWIGGSLVVVFALFTFVAIVSDSVSGGGSSSQVVPTSAAAQPKAATVKVTGVTTNVGIYDFGKNLDWTVIDVEVTNNSSRSTSFGVGNQMVIGTDGNTYEVSWTDATSINQNNALNTSIPAHHTMKFSVPVALPEGVTPAVLSVKVGRDPVQEIGLR